MLGYFIYLAKEKGNQVLLISLKEPIKVLLSDYGLLKTEKKLVLIHKLPFHIFEYQGEDANNLNRTWVFFTIVSDQAPELDHFIIHLLVEELKLVGGKLWAAQGQLYYDLKETKKLVTNFSKTLLIIGFPIGTLPA